MALFEIQNFSFAYPKTQEPALKEISFSLEEGELFLLSGASGSGKTTLLRQLKPAIAPYGKRQGAVLYLSLIHISVCLGRLARGRRTRRQI